MHSISVSHKHQHSNRHQVLGKEIELVANEAADYVVKKRKFIELSQEYEERIANKLPMPNLKDPLLGASPRDMVA